MIDFIELVKLNGVVGENKILKWLLLAFGVLGLVVLVEVFMYFQKTGFLDQTKEESGLTFELNFLPEQGMMKLQESDNFRTIKLVGTIRNISFEGDNIYVRLDVPGGEVFQEVDIDLGKRGSVLGVSLINPAVPGNERNWRNIELQTIEDKLVIGTAIEVEVITWIELEIDCLGNLGCKQKLEVYRNHQEENQKLDRLFFGSSNRMEVSEFSGMTIGPVNTLVLYL